MGFTEKQIKEIREYLEQSHNPLFFFDNDADGLCSFLLLRRAFGKGKGVPIRSFPELNASYFRKVQELKADYIFILDKPLVADEFLKEAEKYNIPIVWIDHHEIQNANRFSELVKYYNPTLNEQKSTEPTTFLCYQVANKKEDIWFAVVGCISDRHLPDFYEDFTKKYADLSIESKNAFDVYYTSQIGKIARIFSFALKDSITNVVNMLKFLVQVKMPYEILEEDKRNYTMHKRFRQIHGRDMKLLIKAEDHYKKGGKLLFFQYGGDLSISSDLSNELSYRFPKKIIVVVYVTGIKANISVRGEKIREAVLKSIEDIDGATGGGHENAVGVQMRIENLGKFRKSLKELAK